jgi:hypothetical protein
MRSVLSEWRDIRNLVAWIVLAGLLVAALMLVTVLSASLLLMLLWWVLRWTSAPLSFLRDRWP